MYNLLYRHNHKKLQYINLLQTSLDADNSMSPRLNILLASCIIQLDCNIFHISRQLETLIADDKNIVLKANIIKTTPNMVNQCPISQFLYPKCLKAGIMEQLGEGKLHRV